MRRRLGLLVMAYGTPYNEKDIEPYFTHIRHGRRPTDEELQDLKERYKAIGGISPLAKITNNQAEKLVAHLNSKQEEYEFQLFIGLKHIHPFIEDAVQKMYKEGIKEAVSIVLAPHYSTFSIKSYNERAKKEAEKLGNLQISSVEKWYDEPKFINYWIDQLKHIFQTMEEDERKRSVVIFSAHSLPERILQAKDPYPEQLEETAKLIAEGAGVENYAIGWQSAGNTPEPWLGPDVQDLTRDLFEKHGYTSFIYCPVGFVADHLEVLYDNDIECRQVTDELGVRYYRPKMPNDDQLFIEALADVVLKTVKKKRL
ncbi:ferrochelatase [Fervidibacillus halotolerans]|uniref:Coproporphyrin III ferrochelatase n=1 Tax=Fervidibacillus halotolerans TaxID=2980027 RepID=A0A9E8RYP3_9BACI|nr:ferrochelatase [Fervidibacillus halotolerans]WAA13021.1 ferrochelatase [Fervidibacillus halotolerans]